MLGETETLPDRQELKGTRISNRFHHAIEQAGGKDEVYRHANGAITRGVMGCNTKDLYQATGSKRGVVASLPEVAQEGLAVGKIAATHALQASGPFSGNQSQVNAQIVETSHEAAKAAGKLFPWNW